MSLVRVATYGGYEPADPFFQTTPDAIDQAVAAFFMDLGVSNAGFVEVRPAPGAELGMCQRNVTEHIKRNGGTLVHVWAIWKNALFLMGEFHAVWRSPAGTLVDVTPTAEGETRVLCAVAEDYGEDFDFVNRPANRAMRTVDPVDPAAVSRAIEGMSPARPGSRVTRRRQASAFRTRRRGRSADQVLRTARPPRRADALGRLLDGSRGLHDPAVADREVLRPHRPSGREAGPRGAPWSLMPETLQTRPFSGVCSSSYRPMFGPP